MSGATHARRSADEQARLDAALIRLFERQITFNTVLDLKVTSLAPGDVRMRLPMKPEFVGHYLYGRLHGGVISATLDAICGLAVMVGLGEHHASDGTEQVLHRFARIGTIDLRIDYLRQGIGQHFEGSALLTRLGGRVASAQARLVNDEGTLIATATGAYIVS